VREPLAGFPIFFRKAFKHLALSEQVLMNLGQGLIKIQVELTESASLKFATAKTALERGEKLRRVWSAHLNAPRCPQTLEIHCLYYL
jgi:hypothetical protein